MAMTVFPRETREFLSFEVFTDGLPSEPDKVEYAICGTRERPTGWQTAQLLEGRVGVLLDNLQVGHWHVWVRITDEPERPVVHLGQFRVS